LPLAFLLKTVALEYWGKSNSLNTVKAGKPYKRQEKEKGRPLATQPPVAAGSEVSTGKKMSWNYDTISRPSIFAS
jgi:hypothetical protein